MLNRFLQFGKSKTIKVGNYFDTVSYELASLPTFRVEGFKGENVTFLSHLNSEDRDELREILSEVRPSTNRKLAIKAGEKQITFCRFKGENTIIINFEETR